MEVDRLTRWLTVGANLGVLIGVVLVLLQMRQNEKLLSVQLTNDFFESYIAADTAFAGENLPAIWQKSVEEPEKLSIADLRALESQTFSPVSRWISLYRLTEEGIVDDSFLESQLTMDVSYYLSSPYGRAWWDVVGNTISNSYLPPALKARIDAKMEGMAPNRALEQYREIQRLMQRYKAASSPPE